MNSKNFNFVAAATAVLLVWALTLALQGRDVVIEFVRGQELVPEIDVDRVNKIEISKGDSKVVLEKRGTGFLVVSRDSYPADGGRINNLIQQCTGITCGREITSAKDAHADLEVDGKAEGSTLVRFMDGDKEITGVVIGKVEESGNYVRLTSQDTVYLSEKSVFLDTSALSFVDKDLCALENIEKVEVKVGDKTYVVEKDGTSQKLLGVPEGMVAKSYEAGQVFGVCRNLTFADFHAETAITDVEFDRAYTVTTEAGEQYAFQLGKKKKDKDGDDVTWYLKGSAKYVGQARLTQEEVDKSKDDPELMKKQEAILQAGEKCQKFEDRHKSWVYEITAYNAGNMTKEFKDLIEEDKEFLKIEDEAIGAVTVKKGEEGYTLESPKKDEVVVKPVPEGKKAKPFVPEQILRAVKGFKWNERLAADDKLLDGLKFESTYTATLRDKSEYAFAIAKNKDNRYFVKPSAEYKGEAGDERPEAAIAKGAVARFNERHKGNVYEVSPGAVDTMMTAAADLFLDKAARPEEIQASHILIAFKGAERSEQTRTKEEAKKKADELLQKVIAAPDDFAKFAKENSDGPTKDKGGDLGRFKFEAMAKAFSEAAFKLEPGQLSGVVESPFGFHIIKRTK